MRYIRPCAAKSPANLALEWDQLAEERHRQIESGDDISYEHITVPTMLNLFAGADAKLVLDIGAGTGGFTARIAEVATRVIGVEPSRKSVAVARESCRDIHNVRLIQASLEEAASILRGEPVTAAVACMTLMATPDINAFANSLASLLQQNARFVSTFCHPCFWPRYWGYETEAWFNYGKETFVEAPFVISKCRTTVRTTHVHRPLEQYVSVFAKAGFKLEALVEPMPSREIQALYEKQWRFPRFIGMSWTKTL